MFRPHIRHVNTKGLPPNELKLARALLLQSTMWALQDEHDHLVKMGRYDIAQRIRHKMLRRSDKIGDVLEKYYSG